MKKKYTKDSIQFGYSLQFKGWHYILPENVSFVSHVKSAGKAHKVANILSGALKRCGKIDNLARANISTIEG